MYTFSRPLYLASHSPRRLELLTRFGIPYTPLSHATDEKADVSDDPTERVTALSERKARAAGAGIANGLILGLDTIVYFNGRILEKPGDAEEAREMLASLSGNAHVVYTGVAAWLKPEGSVTLASETTRVFFRKLEAFEIKNYIKSGEPMDKAGAYGIQGLGGAFIERIEGCFFNVVGLPVTRLLAVLRPHMA